MKPWIKWSGITVVIISFVSLVWWASSEADFLRGQQLEPRLIHAPEKPAKSRAENPGGREFPNRERKVYDLLASKQHQAETLPQAPEPKPMPRPVAKPAPKPMVEEVAQDEIAKLVKAAEAKPAPTKIAAPIPAPQPKEEPKPTQTATGDWGVQLASFLTEQDAQSAAKKYINRYNDLLSNLKSLTPRADLGAKGIRYRVQFVGLTTKSAASSMCERLKKRGQGCFPIKK